MRAVWTSGGSIAMAVMCCGERQNIRKVSDRLRRPHKNSLTCRGTESSTEEGTANRNGRERLVFGHDGERVSFATRIWDRQLFPRTRTLPANLKRAS